MISLLLAVPWTPLEEDVQRRLIEIIEELSQPRRLQIGGPEATVQHQQQMQDAAYAIRTALAAGRSLTDNEGDVVMLALEPRHLRLAALEAALWKLHAGHVTDA